MQAAPYPPPSAGQTPGLTRAETNWWILVSAAHHLHAYVLTSRVLPFIDVNRAPFVRSGRVGCINLLSGGLEGLEDQCCKLLGGLT